MCASPAERVFLGLGSNLGDRLAFLQGAVDALAAHDRIEVVAASGVYETDPVGGPPQDRYLNAVVEVRTDLAPLELLEVAQGVERAAGRERGVRFGPRTLDVDILCYGQRRIRHPRLEVPHPRMGERAFVLVPLAELDAPLGATLGATWRTSGAATRRPGVRATGLTLRVP